MIGHVDSETETVPTKMLACVLSFNLFLVQNTFVSSSLSFLE